MSGETAPQQASDGGENVWDTLTEYRKAHDDAMPEGVRDEQDYREYLEEKRAREFERQAQTKLREKELENVSEAYRTARLNGTLPEGVRDEQDYREYLEEKFAREDEATAKAKAGNNMSAAEHEELSTEENERLREEELERLRQEELDHIRAEELERAKAAEQAEKTDRGAEAHETSTETSTNPEEISTEELLNEWRRNQAQIEELSRPLAAINADLSHDQRELAHDLAEQDLNSEVSKSGFFKKLWKGTLFKKYYTKKYEGEYLTGDRERDGKTIHELAKERSKSAIERFVLGATEDAAYIHGAAGEKLTEADAETTAKVKAAIEKFASAEIPEGKTLEDLKLQFMEDLGRSKAEAADEGKKIDGRLIDNYLDVAIQARAYVEHNHAIEDVMEGFKVYNAEVRDGVRTDVHRDNIDKIVNKLEGSAIGAIVPAQFIAGAASIAMGITQSGARAVAGVAGGLLVSSALSGLKERNRVTEDRARMMRDAANGLEYGAKNGQSKYEARIGGTLYDLQKASDLTANIENALKMDAGEARDKALMAAIAEARIRVDFSDSESKDLIAYSSEDKRGDERLALDMALIRAEKSLPENLAEQLGAVKTHLGTEIADSVDKTDRDFRRTRTALAMKKAGKTLVVSAATFVASQEIIAALDPGKVGLLEKAGIIKTENSADASETLLASAFKFNGANQVHTTDPIRVEATDQATINQLEQAGYTRSEAEAAWTSTDTRLENIDPSSSTSAVRVQYDGWANNSTAVSDGNEISAYLRDGQFVSTMRGNSTFGSEVLNYESLASAGQVKGFITIDGTKFEIASKLNEAGQLTWGEGGVFTTTTGDVIRAVGDNGEKLYKYFEIAVDRGVDANGIQHIIPLATDVGRDTFSGTIQQAVSTVVEHPAVYEFVKTTESIGGLTMAGAFMPETARNGLGTATATEQGTAPAPESNPEPTPTPRNNAEPAAPETESQGDNRFIQLIEDNRNNFGDEGVEILTDTNPYDAENAARYDEWWNGLTEENRELARRIVNALNNAGGRIPFGRAFRDWYNSEARESQE